MPRLCAALGGTGVETMLLSVAGNQDSARCDMSENGYFDQRFYWEFADIPIVRGLRKSSALSAALRDAVPRANVVHNHGLWLLPNIYSGLEAARSNTPLVISPRGMLRPEALRFSALKKRVFWQLLQGSVVRYAACLHATSDQEYKEIREFGLGNPTAVIPNGIDILQLSNESDMDLSSRVVLSLGRLHPKKGLDRLLRAWANVEAVYPGWRLRIADQLKVNMRPNFGPWLQRSALRVFRLRDRTYNEAKQTAFREADLFVLPSLNKNFGITVAEALAAGTPVISTKGAPWSALEREGCGWWIDHGAEPLAMALSNAMVLPRETLKAMGAKGDLWMARDYSWNRVAKDMLMVYRWLNGDCQQPDSVRLD